MNILHAIRQRLVKVFGRMIYNREIKIHVYVKRQT